MYRDDLEAAHARIDALEHELAEARRTLASPPLPPPRPANVIVTVPVEAPSEISGRSLLTNVAIWLILVTVAFASTCDRYERAHHHRHATSTSVLIDCEMKHCS